MDLFNIIDIKWTSKIENHSVFGLKRVFINSSTNKERLKVYDTRLYTTNSCYIHLKLLVIVFIL